MFLLMPQTTFISAVEMEGLGVAAVTIRAEWDCPAWLGNAGSERWWIRFPFWEEDESRSMDFTLWKYVPYAHR